MFDKICSQLSLGDMTAPPVRLSGGFTHRMFRVETDKGTYAVKLLNPEIMQRPGVLDNYRAAEDCEALLEAAELPILPALTINGRKMQRVNGQYLYVFEYYDGRVLAADELTPVHCAKIGEVLAGIHAVQPLRHPQADDSSPVKGGLWYELAADLLSSRETREEGALLQSAVPMLTRLTAAAEEAVRRLPHIEALCHNDMDPKNVLWRGDDFRIIDLECLGYADPSQEMLDLAISWSGSEASRFKAFVSAYCAAGGARPADAALLYDSRRNYLDWLAYNAKRALSADAEERRTGQEQVRWTLRKIEDDLKNREMILRWLGEV